MLESLNGIFMQGSPLLLFVLMFLNGLISIIPSEAVLFVGGVYSSANNNSFFYILFLVVFGNLLGTYILYLIGRAIGYKWLFKIKFVNKFLEEKTLDKMAKKFQREGAYWVGIFRCLPHVKSIISLPAGMIKMPHKFFLIYSFIGITFWALVWHLLGYYFGENFLKYDLYISLILVLFLAATLLVFGKMIKRYFEKM